MNQNPYQSPQYAKYAIYVATRSNRNALDQMRKVLKADTRPSAEISFGRPTSPKL